MTNKKDQVRITGQLHEHAHLAYTTQQPPVAVLTLTIHPAKGRPYHITQVLGTDPTDHLIAAGKLCMLRRGAWVAVYGAGLRDQSDHGVACLAVLDVTDVHVIDLPPKPAATLATTQEA